MLKFLVFALLAWVIWYAFTHRRPGDWPPGDDPGDDEDPGPVLPTSQIRHDPAPKAPESVD
jgi:hypothetical protein